jgi:hypothetical protein
MAKVDAMLSATFTQLLAANTTKTDYLPLSTLSDSSIFQVFEIQAVEVRRIGSGILTGANPVYANLQIGTSLLTSEINPSEDVQDFLYQMGYVYGSGQAPLQLREVLTLPVMVAGDTFNIGSFVRSVAAGTLVTCVNVYGNYRRLSEVDYLRLTCG